MRELIERIIELITRLKGRRCFTEEEVKEMEEKLKYIIDELEKLVA